MRHERGMTLVELLIAMTVFLLVLAAALRALGAQSRGFTKGAEEMGVLQNLRYGADQLDTELRMAGANVPARQPSLVFAGPTSLSLNADLVSNLAGDISAVYVDPDAPTGQVSALGTAAPITIPGSVPPFVYPLADYPNSPAETITFWFTADAETARSDDFVLMRQVNGQAAEPLVRAVLSPAGGGAFFQYWYRAGAAALALEAVPPAWLPLRHSAPQHGQLPDTGAVSRIDDLRLVEVRYQVTNGRTGAEERIRAITTIVPLTNVGVKKLQTCGDEPIFGQPVTATYVNLGGVPSVVLDWNASVDEATGETDVIRYVVWRRQSPVVVWGDPYTSIPSGAPPYTFTDVDVVPGATYSYAVAAQDCTPTFSPLSVSAAVTIP